MTTARIPDFQEPGASPLTEHPRRVVFLSTSCVLDVVSGAALEVRGILETLAAAGHSVYSFTASLFDANTEVDYRPYLGRNAAKDNAAGTVVRVVAGGVEHHVFIARSSQSKNLTRAEQGAMAAAWDRLIDGLKPQILLTYGTSSLSRHMQNTARKAGAEVFFFLANARIQAHKAVERGDRTLVPSHFLANHYRSVTDHAPQVLRTIVDASRYVPAGDQCIRETPGIQREGLVTFINPLPHKGLTLVTRLAQRALSERADMTFAVLEGRATPELLRELGSNLAELPNVWWLPAQLNMRAVYRRTSILLVPSFGQEGFGRIVVEAQLSGIPVLASARGGLGEALGDPARTLPVSERNTKFHRRAPDADTVDVWWSALTALWDSNDAYLAAVYEARERATPFAPDRTRAELCSYFEAVASESSLA